MRLSSMPADTSKLLAPRDEAGFVADIRSGNCTASAPPFYNPAIL